MDKYFHRNEPLFFVCHIDGDCTYKDGETFAVKAPKGRNVYINGKKAELYNDTYTADISLTDGKNTVRATDGENTAEIDIYKLDYKNKYRLSSDDNIVFLWNINENRDKYSSIFEDPYLAVYKKAHDLYGAKVHLNLFYELDCAESGFNTERGHFDLSMMTDKFRDEFIANSDWLKLAFHANKERPDRPYQFASGEQITADCQKVWREIRRFAGDECITTSTTVHWGETSLGALRALKKLGYRSLTGYFEFDKHGAPLVAYHTDGELCEWIGARDFWFDREYGMLFGRIDRVLNIKSLDTIKADIEAICNDEGRGNFVSVMIHEQYFYADYGHYLPDFEERVLWTCKYLSGRGYIGSHISDIW